MKKVTTVLFALALLGSAAPLHAQEGPPPGNFRQVTPGPVQGPGYTTQYIRLPAQGEGLLYVPTTLGPKAHVAVIYIHPGGNNFAFPTGPELASRGYRTMNMNYRGNSNNGVDAQLPAISAAVAYMRSLPGVTKVVVLGHSGGTHEMALYDNVAEHGAAACNGPEKVYPCQARGLDGLQKPDGVILLDPPLGAFHEMSSIDPAVGADVHVRNPSLDMFSAANGFNAAAKQAHYSADFAKRFYAAQSARSNQLVDQALARLAAIKAGKGEFANDEPLLIAGMGTNATGARLYQPDVAFAAHTKDPHLVLKADGSRATEIVRSVRPPASNAAGVLQNLEAMNNATTVREFLSHAAIRTTKDYAITADDITGVDWKSAVDSAPGNAEGVTVPTLIMAMGCHYLMLPAEVIYNHLAAKDKTYTAVEGAVHEFRACKPEYGDTQKRTFDYVDEWLSKPGRF